MTAAWTEAWEGEFDTLDALPRRAAETVGLKEWARPGSRFVFRARFVNEEGLSLSSLRRVVHIKQTTENGPSPLSPHFSLLRLCYFLSMIDLTCLFSYCIT